MHSHTGLFWVLWLIFTIDIAQSGYSCCQARFFKLKWRSNLRHKGSASAIVLLGIILSLQSNKWHIELLLQEQQYAHWWRRQNKEGKERAWGRGGGNWFLGQRVSVYTKTFVKRDKKYVAVISRTCLKTKPPSSLRRSKTTLQKLGSSSHMQGSGELCRYNRTVFEVYFGASARLWL